MLGFGIQGRGITLGTSLARRLKRLAGVTHGLHRHGRTARNGEHSTDDETDKHLFHESTLAAASTAVKQVDGATIMVSPIFVKNSEKDHALP